MPWLSLADVEIEVQNLQSTEPLAKLFAVSMFLNQAFFPAGFELVDEWESCVCFSPAGNKVLQELQAAGILTTRRNAAFYILSVLYWHDLLIDHSAMDVELVFKYLDKLQASSGVRWPYVYGHNLYDKFNATYDGNRTDFLEAVHIADLLEETAHGIFQVGTVLSGPWGFLEASERRVIQPTLQLPLWHCSDPGCRRLHLVKAGKFVNPIFVEHMAATRFLQDKYGTRSEWKSPLGYLSLGKRNWPGGRLNADICAVIADCVIGDERNKLLQKILSSPSGAPLRDLICARKGLRGNNETLARGLSPEEQHQLILMCNNNEIVQALDDLIAERQIDIPPSEVRFARTYTYSLERARSTQISSWGTKSTSHPPVTYLYAQIWNAYEKLEMLEDLTWKVRFSVGSFSSVKHALMDFLRRNGPEAAVRDLVLASRAVTLEIGGQIGFVIRPTEGQNASCRRLLWKLGFRVPRYEDEYQVIRNRIAEFKTAVMQMPPRLNEEERAKIRSIGVNLFVSVEALLEDILVFNLWMLTSDHFMITKFRFAKEDGLKLVASTLGEELKSGSETLRWRIDGANTLGVLLGYLAAFRNWLKRRPDSDPSPFERRREDYPFYAEDPMWIFPYEHTQLWADIPNEVLASYAGFVDTIYNQASQAGLPAIRNGLDHKRDERDFPESDRMLACISRMEQLIEIADSKALIPKLLWSMSRELDSNGNLTWRAEDYRGTAYNIAGPSPVCRMDDSSPRFNFPFILAPLDFLGVPNSNLCFRSAPKSGYSEYWSQYPKRRFINAVDHPVIPQENDE